MTKSLVYYSHMRILTVIPITNNPRIDELTYFSLKDVSLGTIVQVPMRNKEIPALVIKSNNANEMKALLRGGDFSLKRIGTAQTYIAVPESFVAMARAMAKYYTTSTGSLITALLPKSVLTHTSEVVINKNKEQSQTVSEVYALQATKADRIALYKSTVREAFAQNKSILLVAPTIISATKLYEELSQKLEERVFVLTSKNTKVQQEKTFKGVHSSTKPVLLIATAKYAQLFRSDVGTMIIEDEASESYNTLKRPYVSLAECLKKYAELSGIKLILAGTVLSSKTHLALTKGSVLELAPKATRARSNVAVKILDVRSKELDPNATAKERQVFEKNKKPFSALSEELHTHIKSALTEKKKLFILAPRRGLAPLTVCRDCKTPVLCELCDTPVTLRKKKNTEREFLCYKCGETKETDTTCSYCNSWRLDTLGIGIEMIEDELKKIYKDTHIYRVDKQKTKTDKQVQTTIMEFEDTEGILIGTPMILPFLNPVDMSVVASLDAMLSVPSFTIDEKVFALLLRVKEMTKESLFVQTRIPERSVLKHAKDGDIAGFVREELALRMVLKYPPYTVMIKITDTGSKTQIIKDFQAIMPSLEPYGPRVFKQFYQITPSKFALHALLRISTKDYPLPELTNILKNIQPMFEVKVDME